MYRLRGFFVVALLCSAVLWSTSTVQAQTPTPTPSTWGSIKAMYGVSDKGNSPAGAPGGYPNYCFMLSVPFIVQVPPGDWTNTKNCGQACAVMVGGYFNGSSVNSSAISAQNSYLYSITGDSRYKDANGWYTGGSKLWVYQSLLSNYHHLKNTVRYGSSANDVVNELTWGHPVICGVMIKGGRLVSSGGVSHWTLAIGWDSNIIFNDPGTSSGRYIRYSISAFEASWATQGKIYIPVSR